jgi:hypothetical protein
MPVTHLAKVHAGPRAIWTFWRREKSLVATGIQTANHSAQSYSIHPLHTMKNPNKTQLSSPKTLYNENLPRPIKRTTLTRSNSLPEI